MRPLNSHWTALIHWILNAVFFSFLSKENEVLNAFRPNFSLFPLRSLSLARSLLISSNRAPTDPITRRTNSFCNPKQPNFVASAIELTQLLFTVVSEKFNNILAYIRYLFICFVFIFSIVLMWCVFGFEFEFKYTNFIESIFRFSHHTRTHSYMGTQIHHLRSQH